MDQMIADFMARGGMVKRVPAGASTGISTKEWKRMVRGEPEPVELPSAERDNTFHLIAGFGSVR